MKKRNDIDPIEVARRNAFNNVISLPPPPPRDGAEGSTQDTDTLISIPEIIENSETIVPVKNMEFSDKTIRLGFIRKVYSIVLVQLLITGLIIFGCMQEYRLYYIAQENFWAVFGAPMAVYFTTAMCMLCCEGPRKKVPYNYIFLLLFTMSLAVMVGVTSTRFRYDEILLAAGTTFAMVLALTLFAFQTKLDFTTLRACLLSILLALILLGISVLATSFDHLRLVFTTLGIMIISIYIVCDIQLIVGGNHRYSLSAEEYVFAALLIYVDIMYLFLRILRMFR